MQEIAQVFCPAGPLWEESTSVMQRQLITETNFDLPYIGPLG